MKTIVCLECGGESFECHEGKVECVGCHALVYGAHAWAQWNRRPIEDALRAELTAAKAEALRITEGILRTVDASWHLNHGSDWSRPELVLAEYVGDLRNDLVAASAERNAAREALFTCKSWFEHVAADGAPLTAVNAVLTNDIPDDGPARHYITALLERNIALRAELTAAQVDSARLWAKAEHLQMDNDQRSAELAAAKTRIATLEQTVRERNQLCRDVEEDEGEQMWMLESELAAMREVLDGLFSTACNGLTDTESYWMEKASKMLGYSE